MNNQFNFPYYTIEDIKKIITPIAIKHNLKAVYLIGSYARGEETPDSDIDFLYDREGSDITSLTKASSLLIEIKELFCVSVDLISLAAYNNESLRKRAHIFLRNIEKDKVTLYER